MAKSILVTIEVSQAAAPAGQSFDHIAIVVTDSAGASQTARVDGLTSLSAQFDNVAAGTVTLTAQAFDTANQPMGAAATATDTVVDTPVETFPQPISISMSSPA